MSYSLNSLKGGSYRGFYRGVLSGLLRGIQGVWTIAQLGNGSFGRLAGLGWGRRQFGGLGVAKP